LIDDGKARELPVTVGRRLGDLVVVKGAAPGQKVVLSPPERLSDGTPVELAKK
jgi:multidrug efflux pump subunit AcrA (membrane-fusion protein)